MAMSALLIEAQSRSQHARPPIVAKRTQAWSCPSICNSVSPTPLMPGLVACGFGGAGQVAVASLAVRDLEPKDDPDHDSTEV